MGAFTVPFSTRVTASLVDLASVATTKRSLAAALSVAHQRSATSALVMSSPTNAAMRRVALVNGLTHQASDMEWCAAVDIDQECDAHFPSVYQLRQPD
jgi:hypothetical protein